MPLKRPNVMVVCGLFSLRWWREEPEYKIHNSEQSSKCWGVRYRRISDPARIRTVQHRTGWSGESSGVLIGSVMMNDDTGVVWYFQNSDVNHLLSHPVDSLDCDMDWFTYLGWWRSSSFLYFLSFDSILLNSFQIDIQIRLILDLSLTHLTISRYYTLQQILILAMSKSGSAG